MKYDEIFAANKKLIYEKDQLIKELRNKEKSFKIEFDKIKDEYCSLLDKIKELEDTALKRKTKIENQEKEILELRAEMEAAKDQLKSELYISNRRIHDLEFKLINIKTRAIEK